jgi:hypothetical protein
MDILSITWHNGYEITLHATDEGRTDPRMHVM